MSRHKERNLDLIVIFGTIYREGLKPPVTSRFQAEVLAWMREPIF
jgi:hypothetical protein